LGTIGAPARFDRQEPQAAGAGPEGPRRPLNGPPAKAGPPGDFRNGGEGRRAARQDCFENRHCRAAQVVRLDGPEKAAEVEIERPLPLGDRHSFRSKAADYFAGLFPLVFALLTISGVQFRE
jgi:hypothetical protein